jgi:hypothetical protein
MSKQPKGLRNEKKDGTEFRKICRAKGVGVIGSGVTSDGRRDRDNTDHPDMGKLHKWIISQAQTT